MAIAVFAVLFLRLWALQVLSGAKYRVAASDNRVRTLQIEAPRGTIVDRSGQCWSRTRSARASSSGREDLPKALAARLRELR